MVRDFFMAKKIPVMEWPAQSPDLNPIENIWGIIKHNLFTKDHPLMNRSELIARFKEEWDNIPNETLQKLSDSMIHRIVKLKIEKGKNIDY